MLNSRTVWSLVCVLFLSAIVSVAVAQDGGEKPDSPPGGETKGLARLSNDVLDCKFDERGSELWQYQYEPGNWGESCWREHYAIYTANHGSTMESDAPGSGSSFRSSTRATDPGRSWP